MEHGTCSQNKYEIQAKLVFVLLMVRMFFPIFVEEFLFMPRTILPYLAVLMQRWPAVSRLQHSTYYMHASVVVLATYFCAIQDSFGMNGVAWNKKE